MLELIDMHMYPCHAYSILLYEYSFIPYCQFHLLYSMAFSVSWLISESISDFQVDIHTHTLILLIVNAHSNEIIPASLFSAINIKFLCSRVHLSHIILCRLSRCWILFVSGRLFYYVSPFPNGISSAFSTILRSRRKWIFTRPKIFEGATVSF